VNETDDNRLRNVVTRWILPLVGLFFLLPIVGALRAPSLPDSAPTFVLRDLEGTRWDLAELKGKTVVLNFWATWCGPCRAELPQLNAFARNNPDIVVLGLATDRAKGTLVRFARENELDFPILPAGHSRVTTDYNVTTLPTTVVIKPDGTIRTSHTGIALYPYLWFWTL